MKKVVLALLVVLTATSASFAEYTMTATEVDNGFDGYSTWVITVTGDGVNGVTSINDISIDPTGLACGSDVVQIFGGDGWVATPILSNMTASGVAAYALLDTHLLDLSFYSTAGQGTSHEGSPVWEVKTSELIIDGIALPGVAGLGDWGMDVVNPAVAGTGTGIGIYAVKGAPSNPVLNEMEFMQIVLPENTCTVLTAAFNNPTDVSNQIPATVVSMIVGVPEPSTIALLICGALGLIAIRRRK